MAEHDLRATEEQFRLLMASVKDYAIIFLDPNGRVAAWNTGAERMLGYSEDEIVGQPFRRFFTAEDQTKGRPEQELQKARTVGKAENETWHVRKDGSRFFGSGITTSLRGDGLLGYAKLMRDLTERKLTEDRMRLSEERYRSLAGELQEMNARKDRFLAMLSHELRNPLAPILTAIHLLRQQPTANPIQQQARAIVERQVRQLTRLIDDLLEASRLTAGKIRLRKEQTDLRLVIERAVETSRPLIEARKHRLTVSVPERPIWLDADPTRLEQVFSNLLTNAAKYSPNGGHIALGVSRESEQAVVRVRDTGQGIAPELLPHIFDLFTQAEQGLERAQGGLGIGLALVRSLVKMHGGTVEAHSEGVGKGSEFVVRLPIQAPADQAQLVPDARPLTGKATLKVLVVDDNLDAAESLTLLLRTAGHDIRQEHDGPAAVVAAREYRPDVVLLDIGLPGMDGYEVARHLRGMPETRKAVVIALTGYGQEGDRDRTAAAGFDHHLVKPVDPQKLQDLLAVLANRP